MTKSRTALGALAPLLFCSAGPAMADPAPRITAEQVIAAYYARIHEGMGAVDGARTCPRGADGDDAIVVCGRDHDASMRLPLPVEEEPGTRHRLIAGEPPSGMDSVNVGRACCASGGGLNVLGIVGALSRGVDHILHPN